MRIALAFPRNCAGKIKKNFPGTGKMACKTVCKTTQLKRITRKPQTNSLPLSLSTTFSVSHRRCETHVRNVFWQTRRRGEKSRVFETVRRRRQAKRKLFNNWTWSHEEAIKSNCFLNVWNWYRKQFSTLLWGAHGVSRSIVPCPAVPTATRQRERWIEIERESEESYRGIACYLKGRSFSHCRDCAEHFDYKRKPECSGIACSTNFEWFWPQDRLIEWSRGWVWRGTLHAL